MFFIQLTLDKIFVIKKLESNKSESNKFSVYLTGYCKEGELEYINEGNIKR